MTSEYKVGRGFDPMKLARADSDPDDNDAICPECGEQPDADTQDGLCNTCYDRQVAYSEMPTVTNLAKTVEDWNKLYWIMAGGKP